MTSAKFFPAFAFFALLSGGIAIGFAGIFMRLSDVSPLSSISLLIQPLTATIAAWILFHEAIGPLQMAGSALLLWGIYLSKRGS